MSALFIRLLNMSIAAGWIIAVIAVLRLLLRRAPKWLTCLLWAVAGVRLICPVTVESVLSLLPSAETVSPDIVYSPAPTVNSGIGVINRVINPVITQSFAPSTFASVNPLQILTEIAAYVWLAGLCGMLLYAAVSYLRLRRRVSAFIPLTGKVRLCDGIGEPFILGVIRPHIYLPSDMEKDKAEYVTAHENAHLKRGDHLWKPLGFLLLSVYWFNPLCWLAYALLCRDIEFACDEKVIGSLDMAGKKAYSEALLSCSAPRRRITACPLAFGEVGVKRRIGSVLNYKKPAFWIILAAVVACVALAVCFLTNPRGEVLPQGHSYREGLYLPCENGADVIVIDDYGPVSMSADSVAEFDTLTAGDRIRIEVLLIHETYPAQTTVYTLEKLADGELADIDPGVIASLTEMGWEPKSQPDPEQAAFLERFSEVYREAEEVYSRFTGYAAIGYSGIDSALLFGRRYQKVADFDLQELKAETEMYFTDALAAELLGKTVEDGVPLFTEYNGALYRCGGYAGLWPYDVAVDFTLKLVSMTDTDATVRVSAKIADNGKTFSASCDYPVVIDGDSLRFSDFRLIADALWEVYTGEDAGIAAAPYVGYVKNEESDSIDLYTEENGDYIASIPWEMIARFPGVENAPKAYTVGWMHNVSVYYGEIGDFRWAVLTTERMMGGSNKSICTSSDGGKTWWVNDLNQTLTGWVTGAAFATEKVGFISLGTWDDRPYTPVINRTLDGGRTWERLQVGVPDAYADFEKIPLTPVFDGQNGSYPIQLQVHSETVATVCLVTADGGMTWAWEDETLPRLTLDDVIRLAERGEALTWADFDGYDHIDTGSGLYIRVYPIDEIFSLWIGGGSTEESPMYIYLALADNMDVRVEIRQDDVKAFILEFGGAAQ